MNSVESDSSVVEDSGIASVADSVEVDCSRNVEENSRFNPVVDSLEVEL